MINAPCKECKSRTIEPNCHMSCKSYLDVMEQRKKIKEAMNEEARLREFLRRRAKNGR